jgi:hypothetical protein
MTIMSKLALGLCLAALAAAPANAGTCARFGGWGIGVTQDIAKFMSDKATHQAMDKENAKPVTPLKTECNTNAIVYVQCHTTTKACSK